MDERPVLHLQADLTQLFKSLFFLLLQNHVIFDMLNQDVRFWEKKRKNYHISEILHVNQFFPQTILFFFNVVKLLLQILFWIVCVSGFGKTCFVRRGEQS